MAVLVGTSGWNYPTGVGTWNGIFYPRRRPRGFDELAYYAERFDTVEVNSTFYRMPEPPLSQSWLDRTPATFQFATKLYQKFTHPDMYLARDGVREWDLSRADVDLFRIGVDPLAAAGRLAALLMQFPPSFHAEPATREYLDWLLEMFAGYPIAVELRHRSWSDETVATRDLLASRQASWALIDEPKFASSISQSLEDAARPLPPGAPVYLRLHGRNAASWWNHDVAEDRYDYLYSPDELAPFAEAAATASAAGRRVLMYLNNHFSAKAIANAAVLRHQLGDPLPGEYPVEIVDRYPELDGVVTTPRRLI